MDFIKRQADYNAYMREFNSRPLAKQKKRALSIKWASQNFDRVLLSSAKRSAKRRGLEFNLELCDIVIPNECRYLKIPLTTTQGQGIVDSNASIDRIDSQKGYVKGNIQIISHLANQMKSCASKEQLEQFARSILNAN